MQPQVSMSACQREVTLQQPLPLLFRSSAIDLLTLQLEAAKPPIQVSSAHPACKQLHLGQCPNHLIKYQVMPMTN
eukprot:2505189-Amphidinium_carterae.1